MNNSEGIAPMLHDPGILIEDDRLSSALIQNDGRTMLYAVGDENPSNVPVYLFTPMSDQRSVTHELEGSAPSGLLFNEQVQVQVIQSHPDATQNNPIEVQEFLTEDPEALAPASKNPQENKPPDEKICESDAEDSVNRYVVGASKICAVSKKRKANSNQNLQKVIIVTNSSEDVEKFLHFNDVTEISTKNRDRGVGALSRLPSAAEDLSMTCEVVTTFRKGNQMKREVMTLTTPVTKPHVSKATNKTVSHATDKSKDTEREIDSAKLLKLHSNERNLKCTKCSLRFQVQSVLDMHELCHVADKSDYKCFKCNFTSTQWIRRCKSAQKRHESIKTRTNLAAQVAGLNLTGLFQVYQHLFTHGMAKPYKCTICDFASINKNVLASHKAVHNESKDWRCKKCGRPFKHRRNMVAHERICYGLDAEGKPIDPPKHICRICDRELSNHKNLTKHMEIHNNLKPYVCDICGHKTRLKESLVMHKRLHTGEKPFKCNQCDYATPDKSSLRRHKRRHTQERPYACTYCSYKCIQKHCLDTHIRRKHTGEHFVCGVCHYTTHNRYGLNQHFKRHKMEAESNAPKPDNSQINENQPDKVAGPPQQTGSSQDTILTPVVTSSNVSMTSSDVPMTSSDVSMTSSNAPMTPSDVPVTSSDVSMTSSNVPMTSSDVPVTSTIVGVTNEFVATTSGATEQMKQNSAQLLVATLQTEKSKQPVEIASSIASKDDNVAQVELTGSECMVLQEIQQPGDEMFLQGGDIVIRRKDGRILILQLQDDSEETKTQAVLLQQN